MKPQTQNKRIALGGDKIKGLFSKKNLQALFSRNYWQNLWRSVADTPDTGRWLVSFVLAFVFTAIAFGVVGFRSAKGREMIQDSSEMRVLSQDIAKNATESASGNQQALGVDVFDWTILRIENLVVVHDEVEKTCHIRAAFARTMAISHSALNRVRGSLE